MYFLERHGVGRLVPGDDLAAAIESLLANPGELARIQHRAWTLGKRDGALRIAELALALAQSPTSSDGRRSFFGHRTGAFAVA